MRACLGQEAEERQPGEGQMFEPAWKTRLSNLGYRWQVREKDCIGYYGEWLSWGGHFLSCYFSPFLWLHAADHKRRGLLEILAI